MIWLTFQISLRGGCDGTKELGGSVDVLRLTASTFYDKGGKGELAVAPQSGQVSLSSHSNFPRIKSVSAPDTMLCQKTY